MMTPGRRWWPKRRLGLVVAGGCAAVALALAWAKKQVVMASRFRWAAALSHPPAPPSPGQRGPTPRQGKRQRRLQAWANRSDPPGETVEVAWEGGQRKPWWGFSRTAWWSTPRVPPVAIRSVLAAEPQGKLRLAAFFGPDLQATPVEVLPWGGRRWSVAVTCEEARAPLGVETPRQGSETAIARTTPVLLGLFPRLTRLALPLSQKGQIPVPTTAWSHKVEPTLVDGLV